MSKSETLLCGLAIKHGGYLFSIKLDTFDNIFLRIMAKRMPVKSILYYERGSRFFLKNENQILKINEYGYHSLHKAGS